MTSPKHAYQESGNGRYYQHPISGEAPWPSITNILGTCVAKPALAPAAAKVTAAKAWELLPAMVAASRRPTVQEDLTRAIKGHYQQLWSQSADLGTRVHDRVEAHALDKPHADDPEVEPFAVQALRFFADFGVDMAKDVEAAEATVINRTYGYAGTGDLWVWLRVDGKRQLWVIDYKTSLTSPVNAAYPEYGLQTAAVAHGESLLLPNGEETPAPGPIERAGILNLRVNNYALLPMPLVGTIDDAFAAFVALIPATRYLHQCHGAKPSPVHKPRLKVA